LNLKLLKTLYITYNNRKVKKLNELEWIDGYIYANQWGKNHILKIDPYTEKVAGRIDLFNIFHQMKKKYLKAQAPNGIAYNKKTNEILITGKYWPSIIAIQLTKEFP
jgi:glutamine cyclotransferase